MLEGSDEVDETVETDGFAGYRLLEDPLVDGWPVDAVEDVAGLDTDLVSVLS